MPPSTAEQHKQVYACFAASTFVASCYSRSLFSSTWQYQVKQSVMWHLRPATSGRDVIDLDQPTTSAALPTASDAETLSNKRRCREAPRPSSTNTNQLWSELNKQRQESVATALQLYSNPKEAGIKLLLPSTMDLTDNPFTHCSTEQMATSCLHSKWAPFAIFGRLLDGLPSMQDSRHSSPSIDQPPDYKSIFFGAYSQGPLVGLRAQTRRYPMVSRLLNAVLYTLSGVHNHSTVFLARNRAMGLHSDSNNHQDVPNVLIPLSVFSGGQLFVESEEGDVCLDHLGKVRGYIYPITLPFLSFDAQKRHSILPWSGCRLILGSFHIRGADRLPYGTRNVLRSLGYSLCQEGTEVLEAVVPALPPT